MNYVVYSSKVILKRKKVFAVLLSWGNETRNKLCTSSQADVVKMADG